MNKYVKYGLLATGSVALIAAAGAVYLIATFDPNDYKPQIIQAVKDSKQRDLKLDGDIKLTFFPSIGASLGKVSLSEHKSPQEFAAIDSAQVSLALLPLLSKQVVVEKISVSGVKVQLIKHRDGKLNIDDLLSQAPAASEAKPAAAKGAPIKFDIAAVSIDKTALSYRDEASGAQYAVQDVSLKTGRVANGVPSKIEFAVKLQGNQPKLDIAAHLKTTLTFDLEKNSYQLDNLDLQASGRALDFTDLKLAASGDLHANLAAQEFGAKKFALSASAKQGANNLEAKLDAPALDLNKDKVAGEELVINAAMTQPEQSFKVKLATLLAGNLGTQQFSLPKLSIALNATGDKLPNKSVSSELQGSVQLDVKKQSVAVALSGGLLQSQIKADVALHDFARPAIRFDVDVDQFDADLYLPKKAESTAPAAKSNEPEQPFDLTALRSLNLDGRLAVGKLKAANIKASQLRIAVKARDGRVDVDPLSLNLYQGSAKLSASVNAKPDTPTFAVNGNLSEVDVAPLIKDAVDLDVAEGRGNITLNLTTQGNTVTALKKSLNGNLAVNLADGAIKGIDLAKLVQGIQSLGKKSSAQTMGINKNEKTQFSEFKASFKVNNGVAHNDDLAVKAPVLRIAGMGDIDIGHDSLNYTAKVTFSKTEGGGSGTLPVTLSGPFADLKYKVDYGALVADVAKQKVEAKKEELKAKVQEETKAKVQDELKKGLKGLFK